MREDIEQLTHGDATNIARTVRGRSVIVPSLGITAELWSRGVADDGSFPGPGSAHLLRLLIAADPSPSADEGAGSAAGVAYVEATAWRNVLIPSAIRCYLLEDPVTATDQYAPQWHFAAFVGRQGEKLLAPSDFDWVAHRLRFPRLRVSSLDSDGNRTDTTYQNLAISPFYQPYSEARGRYWDISIGSPPAEAGITRCFDALAIAIRRRGAMASPIRRRDAVADDIRPVSLIWKHDDAVELILRDHSAARCYRLVLNVPTDTDLDSGVRVLQPEPGGLSSRLTSPEQYGANEVARIRGMGSSGLSLWADPIP